MEPMEALNKIINAVDRIEDYTEEINIIKDKITGAAQSNDNGEWEARYNKLRDDYINRFNGNTVTEIEDDAQLRRDIDWSDEEKEKKVETDIELEDLFKN